MTLLFWNICALALAGLSELGILLSPFIFRFFPSSARKKIRHDSPVSRVAAVVCAHNEESTIGDLLTTLREQTRPAEAVYVIADNCSDRTAAIAGAMGAIVLEKGPTAMGGKADALKFFLEKTRHENFDAFVFFDADTMPNALFLEKIIPALERSEMAVGTHKFDHFFTTWAEAGNSLLGHVMWYHYLAPRYENGVHALVMGMGYGLRRSYLERLQWTPRTRTEDLALSLDAALTDADFRLCPEAHFRDKQPETWSVSWNRMRRWMTGDLQCLRSYFFPLLKRICHGDVIKLDFLLFLLFVPALILKAFGMLFLIAATCFGNWEPLAILLGFDFFAAVYAVLSKREGISLRPFGIPAFYCFYLQLPWIAFSTLFFPVKQWVPGRQAPCEQLKKQKSFLTERA